MAKRTINDAKRLANKLLSNTVIPEALPIGLRSNLRSRFEYVIKQHFKLMKARKSKDPILDYFGG